MRKITSKACISQNVFKFQYFSIKIHIHSVSEMCSMKFWGWKQDKCFVFSVLGWTHRISYSQSNSAERGRGDCLEDHMWCNAACITLYLPQLMTVRPVSPASTSQLLWGNVVCQAQYGVSALNNGGLVLPGWHHCHSFSFFFWREGFVSCCCFCYCCFSYMSL